MNALVEKVPLNETYLCFGYDAKEIPGAVECFERRFGYSPEKVIVHQRMLWVGPVREEPGGAKPDAELVCKLLNAYYNGQIKLDESVQRKEGD